MKETILTTKAFSVILYLEDAAYLSKLAKKTNLTHSHISKALRLLEERQFIQSKKYGRIKKIYLTPKGKILHRKVQQLIKMLHEPSPSQSSGCHPN